MVARGKFLRRAGENAARELVDQLDDFGSWSLAGLRVGVLRLELKHHRLLAANALKRIPLHDSGMEIDISAMTAVDEAETPVIIA